MVSKYSVPIIKGKYDINNCNCYGAVKFLEHSMKVVKMVLDKRMNKIATVREMQFGLMPERGTIDAVLVFWSLQKTIKLKWKQ